MPVRVTCPNPDCGAAANVEEQSLGRRGRCKKCGHVFALARPDGGSASAMSDNASAWKGSAPASPTNLPEQFGRYRIMRQLGQGGMGAVYLAHDTKLERLVALKVPFFHPADGPQAVQRFEREARAAATLDHPNLCRIFDIGEVDGVHYLTMPYIEGKTLADALSKDQTVTEAQAAAVVRKLALALQEAHEKGIVHRDLKPGNIMIDRRRDLIIMDFGLARMVGGDEDNPLTRTGHVLGTALYMAPEQAAGDIRATGPACDVYSLGVILYELLTGRRPFEGPGALVIGLKSVQDPDPPSRLRPGLDPTMDAICLKAIAKDPKGRYATMAEFARALETLLAIPAPTTTASGKSRPPKSPDSLAAQVFEGIISQEVNSLGGDGPAARMEPAIEGRQSTRFLKRSLIVAGTGAAAVLLLIGIIYIATGKERIKLPTPPSKRVEVAQVESFPPGIPKPDDPPPNKPVEAGSPQKVEEKVTDIFESDRKQDRTKSIVGFWNHWINGSYRGEIEFRADGSVVNDKIGSFGRWSLIDSTLTIRWPNALAPDGMYIDKVELSSDRSRYTGTSKGGSSIRGTRISKAGEKKFPGPHAKPAQTARTQFVRYSGEWSMVGPDVLQTDSRGEGNGGGILVFGNPGWTDYDLSVDLMRVEGNGNVALVLRSTDEDNHIGFVIGGGKGTYNSIASRDSGKVDDITPRREFIIKSNQWYNARVSIREMNINASLHEGNNNVFSIATTTDLHPRGRVGLLSIESIWRFRNIKLTTPNDDLLWEGLPSVNVGKVPATVEASGKMELTPEAVAKADTNGPPNTTKPKTDLANIGQFNVGMTWHGSLHQYWEISKESASFQATMTIVEIIGNKFKARINIENKHIMLVSGTLNKNGSFSWSPSNIVLEQGEGKLYEHRGELKGNGRLELKFEGFNMNSIKTTGIYDFDPGKEKGAK